MKTILITGSLGLVGSAAAHRLHNAGYRIIGVDNDTRKKLFGPAASTLNQLPALTELPHYEHHNCDIRDQRSLEGIFKKPLHGIIHAAGQPSHEWSANEPLEDFSINALGTATMLELARTHTNYRETPFIFLSTNKVYGDAPNQTPMIEEESRYSPPKDHTWAQHGVDETLPLDQTMHSPFGASKTASDIMVQEYGRYYEMPTTCLRAGCITGTNHQSTEQHGFLSHLSSQIKTESNYTVIGYKGKQVRDNLHANDLAHALTLLISRPPVPGTVYNIGGGMNSNTSILEAIQTAGKLTTKKARIEFEPKPRKGDHIWWISDTRKFQKDYPEWNTTYTTHSILQELLCSATNQ